MIKKEDIDIYCYIHDQPLHLVAGTYSMYYRCECYDRTTRSKNEKSCMNRINLEDTQKILATVIDLNRKPQNHFHIGDIKVYIADTLPGYVKIYVDNTAVPKRRIKYSQPHMLPQ